jgi:hypothetical protein
VDDQRRQDIAETAEETWHEMGEVLQVLESQNPDAIKDWWYRALRHQGQEKWNVLDDGLGGVRGNSQGAAPKSGRNSSAKHASMIVSVAYTTKPLKGQGKSDGCSKVDTPSAHTIQLFENR